jgi:hypothetical protein
MHATTDAAKALIEQTVGTATAEELGRPVPGKWSPAQILEHLRLSYHFTTRALDRLLAGEERPLRTPTLWQRIARWVVIDVGYFPKVQAPSAVRPDSAPLSSDPRGGALLALDEMDAALARAEQRFGADRPVVTHPRFAAMSVAQWRAFHLAHTRHHLRQVRERLGRA